MPPECASRVESRTGASKRAFPADRQRWASRRPRRFGGEIGHAGGPSFAAVTGAAGVLAAGPIRDDPQALPALARVGEQPPPSTPVSLPVRTSSHNAAFTRASTTALAGEGRATEITRASVVGAELHMHRDGGVSSIGHGELIAVLLLRQQRGHAVQPAPGLWNGRRGAAMADCCFLAERRPVDADITSQLARPHVVPVRPVKELPIVVPPPRPLSGTDFQRGQHFRFHARVRLLATRSAANKAQPRGCAPSPLR
jgi:hypothetical protein